MSIKTKEMGLNCHIIHNPHVPLNIGQFPPRWRRCDREVVLLMAAKNTIDKSFEQRGRLRKKLLGNPYRVERLVNRKKTTYTCNKKELKCLENILRKDILQFLFSSFRHKALTPLWHKRLWRVEETENNSR